MQDRLDDAPRIPAPGPQDVANHNNIQAGRIAVKKLMRQKESRAKSQSPGFNI
jgi:hypothetical protein